MLIFSANILQTNIVEIIVDTSNMEFLLQEEINKVGMYM